MAERGVDRTSLIKLGLYMFTSYMSRHDVRLMPMEEVVASIESHAPKRFPCFYIFSMETRPALRRRRISRRG